MPLSTGFAAPEYQGVRALFDSFLEDDPGYSAQLAVYHGHFKCNRQKLSEMPALWGYARDLFQTPGFGDTIDFVQIKQH